MSDPGFEPPVNPLPPVVTLTFLGLAGVEVGLSLAEAGIIGGPGAIGWRIGLIRDYGFIGQIFDWMMVNRTWPLADVARLVTYPVVHLEFTHALFALVLLLALGKMVAEAMGPLAFLGIFWGASIGAAALYGVFLNDPVPLVGAYPAVYGLIGGYSFAIWRRLAGTGAQQYRAFSLIAILMGIQLLFGVFFVIGTQWVAEFAGFCIGFALCFALAPGEWERLRDRMRQR